MLAALERSPLAPQLERALTSGLEAGARLVDVLAAIDVGLRARGWSSACSVAVVRPRTVELAALGGVEVTCYTASVPVRVVARSPSRSARLGARAYAGLGATRDLVHVVDGSLRASVDVVALGASAYAVRDVRAPQQDAVARAAALLLSPYLPSEP